MAAPIAPDNLVITTVTYKSVSLAWDDFSDDETGFRIESSPDGTTGWMEIDTVGENIETYMADGLDPSTDYYFRVRAYNGDGNSDYTEVAGGTTNPYPLKAEFDADLLRGFAPLRVAFASRSTITEEAVLTGVLWDFGDGATSTEPNPVHIYDRPGLYTVILALEGEDAEENPLSDDETKVDFIDVVLERVAPIVSAFVSVMASSDVMASAAIVE